MADPRSHSSDEYEKDEERGTSLDEATSGDYEGDLTYLREVPTEGLHNSRLARIKTGRENYFLSERGENALASIRSRRPVPAFQHPLTHTKTAADVIVNFEGKDDPYMPMNWSIKKKTITTVLYSLTTMASTWASSAYSPAVGQIAEHFHVGTEVSVLGVSLLLFGYGVGPLLWAPLSEIYGRKPAVLLPFFINAIFAFAAAASKDFQTLMLSRFFAGFFGAAPIVNTGGVLGDLFAPEQRGLAMVGYALSVCMGPLLAPIVSSAIVDSHLRWRWTEYISGILQMTVLCLDMVFVDESYPPALLVKKAKHLRIESGNWALHAKHEEWDVTFKEMCHKYFARPFQLLATPICIMMVAYASFVYAILYACLAVFPIEFQEIRGWNPLQGSLAFVAALLGCFLAGGVNILNNKYYVKCLKANNGRAVPEARLPPMMIGSVFFSAGLFLFAWTSDKNISAVGPMFGAGMVGFGFLTIFQSALNYLIDTFLLYAASAVAANTFMRSILAGVFPLFITQMMHGMGVGWGLSVWGFIGAAMIPIPFLFFVFGKRIRASSEWSKHSV